jgi:hypothetical protein
MRILAIVAALLVGLIGLAMSLCGGGVTLMAVFNGNFSALGVLAISLPCLGVGVSLILAAIKLKKRAGVTRDPANRN